MSRGIDNDTEEFMRTFYLKNRFRLFSLTQKMRLAMIVSVCCVFVSICGGFGFVRVSAQDFSAVLPEEVPFFSDSDVVDKMTNGTKNESSQVETSSISSTISVDEISVPKIKPNASQIHRRLTTNSCSDLRPRYDARRARKCSTGITRVSCEIEQLQSMCAERQDHCVEVMNHVDECNDFCPKIKAEHRCCPEIATEHSCCPEITTEYRLHPRLFDSDNVPCPKNEVRPVFRHLGTKSHRERGYCNACGFLGCMNKCNGSLFFDGWAAVGVFGNTRSPDDRNNQPLTYNDRNAEAGLNQLYLSFGRRATKTGNRFDWGAQVDLLYGTDYYYTSALGLETTTNHYFWQSTVVDPLEAESRWNANHGKRRFGTAALYGLSMPQLFGELYIPFYRGLTIKAGHFYAGMGLESVQSPRNFFYSHSYGFMYGMPTTLTGATATMKLDQGFSGMLGLSQGWNIYDNPHGNVDFLGGLRWSSRDRNTTVSFTLQTGNASTANEKTRTNYVLTFSQRINPCLTYALEHSYGSERDGAFLDLMKDEYGTAQWYSLAGYMRWNYNANLAFGARIEWFRDDGHSRILKGPVSAPMWNLTGKDYYAATFGLNWTPTRYITIRPEIRYDWTNVRLNDTTGALNNCTEKDMFSVAVDAVFRF